MRDLDLFRTDLLAWFAKHGRDLPWRRTQDPYQIWISEMMLQQTQVSRVIGYFERWVERFPTMQSLAEASEGEVLRFWEGLGYSSRALHCLAAARVVAERYHGRLPDDMVRLRELPGIGPYSAGALLSIAFHREEAAVDGNVCRVLARLFNLKKPVTEKTTRTWIEMRAKELIPKGQTKAFNQALMELGALICVPKRPKCVECPVKRHCQAERLGVVLSRPVPGKKNSVIPIVMATGVLVVDGMLFVQKRLPAGVWANLWEFPGGVVEPGESPEEALVREFIEETELSITALEKITVIRYSYTKYRVTMHAFFCSLGGVGKPILHVAQEWRWADLNELQTLAFPAGHRRLIDHLKQDVRIAARLSIK